MFIEFSSNHMRNLDMEQSDELVKREGPGLVDDAQTSDTTCLLFN